MSDSTYTLTIPQHILNHYNRQFNNRTYRAVADNLNRMATKYAHIDETYCYTVMNLVIDTSFERSGADFYRGAEQRLQAMLQLVPEQEGISDLIQLHLDNFGAALEQSTITPEVRIQHKVCDAKDIVEEVARSASEIASWRGRVAYAWTSAAGFLLHAAYATLIESSYDSYPLEKLDRALSHIADGILEAPKGGFSISDRFVAWIRGMVKARW